MSRTRETILAELTEAETAEAAGLTVYEYRQRESAERRRKEAARQAGFDWTPFLDALRDVCERFDVELWACGCCDGINAIHGDYVRTNV